MITIIKADGTAEKQQLKAMRERASQTNTEIELAVAGIMQSVKEKGFVAVKEYSREFDHAEPYEIGKERLEKAYLACPKELVQAMERAARNIRDYNEKLLTQSKEWKSPDGGCVGRIVRGLTRVGI